ncbi:Uncharacterised protein [Mycobacteroides abscessus]|nr:Uncharacterised protein [Mycobacteroides abscessus]SHU17879.1 Uncharacterised protein [Mycobacteroides abscessus subsp. abscessus]
MATVVPGCWIRSRSCGPGRARTHNRGVNETGWGTVNVRMKVPGSSGARESVAAHRNRCGEGAHPDRPCRGEPRSQPRGLSPAGGGGTVALWRRSTVWANPAASYCVRDSSVTPNCTPEVPSSVPVAVTFTQVVSPGRNAMLSGWPGSSNRTEVVPLSVSTSSRRTCAPRAVALGVTVRIALVIGRSKSMRIHCPSAASKELLTQLVALSRSIAAAVLVPGATLGSAVESDAELEAVMVPPVQLPLTSGTPVAG